MQYLMNAANFHKRPDRWFRNRRMHGVGISRFLARSSEVAWNTAARNPKTDPTPKAESRSPGVPARGRPSPSGFGLRLCFGLRFSEFGLGAGLQAGELRPHGGKPWLHLCLRGVLAGMLAALLLLALPGCQPKPQEVVIYCAQDQVYAEPLFQDFTQETGLRVRPLFDSEAMKTVGLANRLLAEREHPQADVYWGNEELRSRQLAARDVFRPTNAWAAFGYRSRRLVVNTNLLAPGSAPTSLLELTNARWRGKVSLAYPLFGTTATHFLALRQQWGPTNWLAWCRALATNEPFLEEGNSGVVKRVGRGAAVLGLTDSDDVQAGQREGLSVVGLPLTAEALLIPNTVGVIRQAPHPEAAQRFFEWVQRPTTMQKLVAAGALEGAAATAIKAPTLQPDWGMVLRDLTPATEELKQIFLK
jgi:iron(III) transport system substrate-binding protein